MLQLLSPQGETSGGKVLAPVPMHQLSLLGMDTAAITRKIEEFLPSYMIPDRYIAVERLPTSLAAKLDRKRVESWLTQPPSEVLPRWGSETESEIRDVEPMLGPDETVAIAISCRIAALMERDRDVSPVLEGRDFAIAAAGLDSIQVTSLVGFLRQTYAVNIPVRKMLDGTATVRSLAALVTHDKPAGTEPRSIDLTGEVARLVRTVNRQLPAPRVPSPQPRDQVVFLTGCTSLLGTEILHQLCETPDVRQVIVHVRAKTAQEASTRCKNAARRANWWSEERHGHKVEVWAGDLSQPRLGLSDQHWACISGGPSVQGSAGAGSCVVDAIIHAGAAVNWNAGYGLLRAVNVDSTVDLIRAALASPARPRLVYVSGGHSWDLEETDASLADQVVSSGSGYSQSKFVAEMVVRHFAAHHPYSGQLSIVKPGLIIGTPQDGVPNIDDYLWRITAAAVGVGSYSAEDLNTGLWITSSCQVAETIVRKALALEASDRPITYITDGVTVSEYWDTVNDALGGEQRLIAVPHDLWVSRVTQAIDIRGRNHPLWPVKEIFEEVDGHFGGADFSSLRLDHHKPHVKAAIRKNVEFLVKLDFLGASDEKARPSSEGAFRRTGQVWSSAKTA
ncbi:amino acid adenylation [Penicillium hordei]|uniref:Amino acid adenylation n=1 Tax=Penicillium hordei TaxID=40994 RepID=A0AAD6DZY1_9EURO|nr:amino acid adenylation [Penicillium hordei]KAJ5598080.1 amino acid adenylation [Penicillium hordei]